MRDTMKFQSYIRESKYQEASRNRDEKSSLYRLVCDSFVDKGEVFYEVKRFEPIPEVATSSSSFPQFLLFSSSSHGKAIRPQQIPQGISDEMQDFLSETGGNASNCKLISMALFERPYSVEKDSIFLTSINLKQWLSNKFMPLSLEKVLASIICPYAKNIVDQPIIIPGTDLFIEFEVLKTHSVSRGIWQYGKFETPDGKYTGLVSELRPAYGNQSLIARLINRLHQFRWVTELEDKNSHADAEAVARYKLYKGSPVLGHASSNESKICALTGVYPKIALELLDPEIKFIKHLDFIKSHPEIISKLSHPGFLEVFIDYNLSLYRLPIVEKNSDLRGFAEKHFEENPESCRVVAYEAQDFLEQAFNISRECRDEIELYIDKNSKCCIL